MRPVPVTDGPTELPAYRALLVVDARRFSSLPGRDHARVTDEIPVVLRRAFDRAGLTRLWEEAAFRDSTGGDSYYCGLDSRYLPSLLNPLLGALQDELVSRNAHAHHPIRLRASIHVGPLTGPESGKASEGSGAARIETHRLLDSDPVRSLLESAGQATCVAAIVSERAYLDAVASGYAGESPDLYRRVRAERKEYGGAAYLRVPLPSGGLLDHGFLASDDDAPGSGERPSGAGDDTPTERLSIVTGDGGAVKTVGGADNRGTVGDGNSGVVVGDGNSGKVVGGDLHHGARYGGGRHETHNVGDGHVHIGRHEGTISQTFGGGGRR